MPKKLAVESKRNKREIPSSFVEVKFKLNRAVLFIIQIELKENVNSQILLKYTMLCELFKKLE